MFTVQALRFFSQKSVICAFRCILLRVTIAAIIVGKLHLQLICYINIFII